MRLLVLPGLLAILLVPKDALPAPAPAAPAASADRLAVLEEQLRALQEQLANQELAAAQADAGGATLTSASDPSLRLYGFADVGLQQTWLGSQAALNAITPTKAPTFVLGNINLYLDAQPSESWSALVELRLTNLPHGSEFQCIDNQPCQRTSTEIYDLTSGSGGWNKLRWGSIVLERAYLQWHHSDKLTVRAGLFLTPFGIWNIDHGTPTLISLMLPQFEGNELFPLRQVGIELLGSFLLEPWELGYFAYISNGRSPGEVDYTGDKMLGGRLFARRTGKQRWTFGLSGLTGRFSDQQRQLDGFGGNTVRTEVIAYREWAGGADVSLDVGALRVRSELAVRRVDYERGKRAKFYNVTGLFNSDRLEWDVYALAAYQLPWWGIEPFVFLELYRFPTPLSEGVLSPSFGFNVHFTPYAQLKVQYLRGIFLRELSDPGDRSSNAQNFHLFGSRLVLAF